MQIIKSSTVAAVIFAAGAFSLLAPRISMAADMGQPGKGWDAFNSRGGEAVPSYDRTYMGTSMQSAPGQGWDAFQARSGVKIPVGQGYKGTSMAPSSGEGWDVFHSGIGDPI